MHIVKLQKFSNEFCVHFQAAGASLISTSTGNGFCSIMASTPRCGRGDLCSIHSRGNPIRKATFGTECNSFFCLSNVDFHDAHVPTAIYFLPVPGTNSNNNETITGNYFDDIFYGVYHRSGSFFFFLLKKKNPSICQDCKRAPEPRNN